MAQQKIPQEINNFSAGLNTDANPLNTPPNSCYDISNMVLERNGTSRRRFGIDYEPNYVEIETSINNTVDAAVNSFKWENVGGDNNKSLLVSQVGNEIKIIDLDSTPISDGVIYTYKFTSLSPDVIISFSSIDSILVCVNGDGFVYSFEYDEGTITDSKKRILVRDLWGVEATDSGLDLSEGNNVIVRPSTITDEHLYNLRNQTFGISRPTNTVDTLQDPIDEFKTADGDFPSNSDSVNYALYPKSASTTAPLLDRFWPSDLSKNKIGTFEASKGYFIIDLLNRGSSRLAAEAANINSNSGLIYSVSSLPQDSTEQGATVTAEFAGRVFFGGFGNDVTNGDNRSPRLASYITFSTLVTDVEDVTNCYQKSDPTSNEDNDIVATDGGFVRIDGAYNIQKLIPTGSSLMIVAQNGVWRLLGGSNYGFASDNYRVDKVSDEGCRSPNSVVYVDGNVLYWGDNGIFQIGVNQLGDWGVTNITKDRIQNIYNQITTEVKSNVIGLFDKYDRKVRWLYNNKISNTDNTKELVFDLDLSAFYINTFSSISNNIPKVYSIVESNPFQLSDVLETVIVGNDVVQVSGDDVEVSIKSRNSTSKELIYLTVTSVDDNIKYTVASLSDLNFVDWVSHNGTGVDAGAYIITNVLSTGDNQRRKKSNSIMTHLERTETGMFLDTDGQLQPDNPSSCLVQARWDWSNSNNSNRWSQPRQFYRYKRYYSPENLGDSFDTGFSTIITKDILRGHGKALSLKIYTEPLKNLKLHGMSIIWGIGENEGD